MALHSSHGGAERHADADLLGLLGHGVRDNTVDSQGGEQDTESGEDGDQQDKEAARRDGMIDQRLQGPKLGGGLVRIERTQCGQNTGGEGLRCDAGPDNKRSAFNIGVLRDGHIDFGAGALLERALADVSDDANNAIGVLCCGEGELADGVFPRPLAAGGSFIDHDDTLGAWRVVPGEIAAGAKAHAHRLKVARRYEIDESSGVGALGMFVADRLQAPLPVAVER